MRTGMGWLLAGLLLLVGVVCLYGGCDDEPTRSRPPKPDEPKDYPVYFLNDLYSKLWIFHPLTQKLDSMVVPYTGRMRGITASADGQLLYIGQQDRVLVVTADSLALVKELAYDAWFGTAISPDNSLLAIMGQQFYILRTTDWGIVFTDSTRVEKGVFSNDSRTFYASDVDSTDLCWIRPFDSVPAFHHRAFHSSVTDIQPTPDGTKLLMCLLWHFVSYDIAADSILFDIDVWPGHGQLGITPDGRHAFFGNPSTPFGDLGTVDLYAFDVLANRLVDTIDPKPFLDSIGEELYGGIGRMVVTPDGRWIVAHNYWPPTQLMVFNLKCLRPVYFHSFGGNNAFVGLTVQQDL